MIYRRIDDDLSIGSDSAPIRCWAWQVDEGLQSPVMLRLPTRPGTGVVDDKVVYTYVPQAIKYYLGEEIIPNVPTHLCWIEKDRKHVLGNLDKLVVKAANESVAMAC